MGKCPSKRGPMPSMFDRLAVYQKAMNFIDQTSGLTRSFPRRHFFLHRPIRGREHGMHSCLRAIRRVPPRGESELLFSCRLTGRGV